MPWNSEVYNKFKNIRYQPFFDLIDLIIDDNVIKAIDLGCGTGEQTYILAEKFKNTSFTGIDSSPEMLAASKALENERLKFKQSDTESIIQSGEKWDLIFSNAALQWSDHHQLIFPQLIGLLNNGGQFAVQMPVQKENQLNQILLSLAEEEPFKTHLKGWKRETPMLSIDDYAGIMFRNGLNNLQIIQKVYPIIASDHNTLFDFISGSALIPYMERLEGREKELFIQAFKERIAQAFNQLPALYAFKRLLLYGRKS